MASQPPTLPDLLQGVSNLVGRKRLRDTEEAEWWAGSIEDSPNGDGMYPRTDADGTIRFLPSIDLIQREAIERAGTIGLFSDIKTKSILPSTKRLVTVGFDTAGVGAADYVEYTGPNPAEGRIMTQSADGRWWRLDASRGATLETFGIQAAASSALPADITASIQSAMGTGADGQYRRRFNIGQNFNIRKSPAEGGATIGLDTLYLRRDQSFVGEGWSSKLFVNPNSTARVLFALNTNGQNGWIDAFSGVNGAVYGNFYLDGRLAWAAGRNPIAFEVGLSAHIFNVHVLGLSQGIRAISQYIDQVWIDRITFVQEEDGLGNYFVELWSAGDGCLVSSSHASLKFYTPGYYGDVPRGRNTRMRYKVGSEIVNSLNGDHELYGCDGFEMRGFHQEFGQLIMTGSSGTLRNHNSWSHGPNAPNLRCPAVLIRNLPGLGNITPGIVYIADCGIIQQQGFHGGFNEDGLHDVEIEWPWYGHLKIERYYRKSRPLNVTPAMAMKYGIELNDQLWNSYSHIASVSGEYIAGELRLFDTLKGFPAPLGGLTPSLSGPSTVIGLWKAASGTYHYAGDYLYDKERMLGFSTANKVSMSLVTEGGAALLFMESPARVMMRFYRGPADDLYDKYVDVPVIAGFRPVDTGFSIGGFVWKDRTPGPKDALNVGVIEEYNIHPGDLRAQEAAPNAYGRVTVYYRSSLEMPTVGEHHWGDEHLRRVTDNRAGSHFLGYRRRTNGTGNVLGVDWVELWENSGPTALTTNDFATKSSFINQPPFKKAGFAGFNTVTKKALWAAGDLPENPWVDALGAVAYTPS